jgi:hypothetical protein
MEEFNSSEVSPIYITYVDGYVICPFVVVTFSVYIFSLWWYIQKDRLPFYTTPVHIWGETRFLHGTQWVLRRSSWQAFPNCLVQHPVLRVKDHHRWIQWEILHKSVMVRVFLYLKKWEVPKSLLTNPVLFVEFVWKWPQSAKFGLFSGLEYKSYGIRMNVHFGHNSLTICISYDMVMEVLINSRLGLALMKMLRFIQSYEKLMMRSVWTSISHKEFS